MSRDGQAENCSLHFPHFPLSVGSYSARSQEGGAVMSRDGRLKIAPCIFRTSHVHVGRQKIAPCIFRTSHVHVGRLKIAPCIFRTSHVHVGRQKIAPCIFRTSHVHVGRQKIAPCIFRTSHHPWRSYFARSQDGGADVW